MIYREFKIKDDNRDDEPICYSCLLKTVYDLSGFRNNPKKLAEDFIADYVRDGEGTIHCYQCGPVRYERFGDGWVEVRQNAVALQ